MEEIETRFWFVSDERNNCLNVGRDGLVWKEGRGA